MTRKGVVPATSGVPAGYTYLGQFTDHDLTRDADTPNLESITDDEGKVVNKRSPELDLDSVYGNGPDDKEDAKYYDPADRAKLRTGTSRGTNEPENDPVAGQDLHGADLPRTGSFSTEQNLSLADKRKPWIPESRNDENLIVAQIHAAFIRFHNHVVDTRFPGPGDYAKRFASARAEVTKHYQWMVRHDFLPRILDKAILDAAFAKAAHKPDEPFHMPLEFSVAAYRFGHSMVRGTYEWNRVFNSHAKLFGGEAIPGTLPLLFSFTGTSGTLSPGSPKDSEDPATTRLPTNWVADYRRLFDFPRAGYSDAFLKVAGKDFNFADRIDTVLTDPLSTLPLGSFGAAQSPKDAILRNLAYRNLLRATKLGLATGQQMAKKFGLAELNRDQIIKGAEHGTDLSSVLSDEQKTKLATHTPLWLYVLREAEFNKGRLTGVGGHIVADLFAKAIATAEYSIVKDSHWRPSLGLTAGTFTMPDLIHCAAGKDARQVSRLDAPAPRRDRSAEVNSTGTVGRLQNQSAQPNKPFPVPLEAEVRGVNGDLLPDARITFHVETGNAAFETSDGLRPRITAISDARGIATAPTLHAGDKPGDVTIAVINPKQETTRYKATITN